MKLITAVLALMLATTANAQAQVLVKHGSPGVAKAEVTKRFDTGWELWKVQGDPFTIAQSLRAQGIQAEVDGLTSVDATPNDSAFTAQYHLNNTGQLDPSPPNTPGIVGADIDAIRAWDVFTGDPNLRVGVVDTGIAFSHPDLQNNIWTNPGEIPGNSIDDDNNGYVDDVRGWDFAGENGVTPDNDPSDVAGHGTHVSGIIAAQGNNGIGVSGVVWRAKIVPVKFTQGGGASGPTSAAISGLAYCRTNGVKIVNCSWSSGVFSQAMYDEIALCSQAGMLLVFSAGNNGLDLDCPCGPKPYPTVNPDPCTIVVGATNHRDERQSFSNYGTVTVDLFAPGWNVLSTIGSTLGGNSYTWLTGTSMSAPCVTGAVALRWGMEPLLNRDQIKSMILGGVDILPGFQSFCFTGGRLNVYNSTQSGGGGGEQQTEKFAPAPASTDGKVYDVQGRRVDPSYQGVRFASGRKRVVVKP